MRLTTSHLVDKVSIEKVGKATSWVAGASCRTQVGTHNDVITSLSDNTPSHVDDSNNPPGPPELAGPHMLRERAPMYTVPRYLQSQYVRLVSWRSSIPPRPLGYSTMKRSSWGVSPGLAKRVKVETSSRYRSPESSWSKDEGLAWPAPAASMEAARDFILHW